MEFFSPDMFIRPVEGKPELVAFQYGFELEGKAPDAPVVTELDDGDLLIEGYAAVFDGLDREGENFVDGAFKRGIKAFLNGQSALCFHHKFDQGIGTVLDLEEHEGKGLYMKARVDHQPESSPLRYIYNAIKRGSYKGLSVGGFFKRKLTETGKKIVDMDFAEISVTPVAVHPGTGFAVVAGKALADFEASDALEVAPEQEALEGLSASLASLTEALEAKALPKNHDPAAAAAVSEVLANLGRVRSMAGSFKEFSDNDDVVALADEIESSSVKWEASLHKLAAKVGPLPPAVSV